MNNRTCFFSSGRCGTRERLSQLVAGGVLALGLLAVSPAATAQVQFTGGLSNLDVRYPASLPNDVEIVIYGDGLSRDQIKYIWNTDVLLGGVGLQWGPGQVEPVTVNNDPNSPYFGLDCMTVRWAGPARPNLVGQMVHLGVSLCPGVVPAGFEVWWTRDGERLDRPCDPRVIWICTTRGWVVCIENPTPQNMYIYGCRWFAPQTGLPFLQDLTTGIDPRQFGASQWTVVDPVGSPTKCIPPWCRIYIRIVVTNWRPIIFQVAARNAPLEETGDINPDDFNPDTNEGTMAILTTRATVELRSDADGNGQSNISDFNILRSEFGTASPDLTPPQDPVVD